MMAIPAVGSRRFASSEAVVDVAPVIWTGIGGVDAELLDGIDRLQHALDLRPAGLAQVNLAAGEAPRPYSADRHQAWLQRRRIDA